MNGKENELGDKWSLRIYFSHLSNLISRCIYIYIYTEVVEACSCADILHLNRGREGGEGKVFTRESRATSEKCIDQNEPGCRDIAYPPVRIDSVPSADKSCQPNSTL